MATNEEGKQKGGSEESKPRFVKNYTELAAELEVAYKTVMRWKTDEDAPEPRADGRHSLEEWQAFMKKGGKKPKTQATKGDLADEGQKLKNRKLQVELAEKEGSLLDIDEVCEVVSTAFAAVMKLRDLKHSLGPQLGGLEVGERTARIGEEIDAALREIVLPRSVKKKAGYSKLFDLFYGLQKQYGLGSGQSST